ncbi:acyl-CoA dehydrogenase family protein [Actinocorallia sp. A-T 12471]|uniref:acyl-CoA dehydrogenase family protein n=1 Tax=Actinocorallia sp. A-T 12471 TaxID=3089813 RepID=UPI0029CD7313|nr:acyl-CoA dehydrogenase family protein [Actinocorallia sp. A-T 12471]MDX6741502.1 acyl-CoA dehydrogenase family protein [Actinocorallia sp. A-T 12471]
MADSTDADLRTLRDSVRAVLAEQGGAPAEAWDRRSGFDRDLWARLSGDLGLAGLATPEPLGGSGGGFRELAVVLEECGRGLYAGPLLPTVLTLDALLHGEPVDKDLIGDLAGGGRLGAVAPSLPAAVSEIRWADGGLVGTARHVVGAADADVAVVEVGSGELFLVDLRARGVTVASRTVLDPTRGLADISFDGAAAVRLAGEDGARRLRCAAAVALACEQVGGAEAALEAAVAYAKVRTQFGRPIGSFQSVKHLLAEIYLDVESGAAAARRAAAALDDDDPELEILASIAKAWCSRMYTEAVEGGLQVHGGIGFTWEHPSHHHLRRAKTSELLFGDCGRHRTHLADLLGL